MQRGEHIRSKKLCYNCLAPCHETGDCRSLARCRWWHTSTSRAWAPAVINVVAAGNTTPAMDAPLPTVNVVAANASSQSNHVSTTLPSCLMMTSQVLVKGPGGKQTMARALLDSGATSP